MVSVIWFSLHLPPNQGWFQAHTLPLLILLPGPPWIRTLLTIYLPFPVQILLKMELSYMSLTPESKSQ
jgi:hypothetical protein